MNKRIIVVDDSSTVCKVTKVILQRAGYEIQCFRSAEDIIRWLQGEKASIPALLIVDLVLPKMDGYSLIRYLRRSPSFHAVPFIVMSRRDDLVSRLKGKLVGAIGYLAKSSGFTTTLLTLVNGCLGSPAGAA